MPRKPPLLSIADLEQIIEGKCADIPLLIEWAKGERERREIAGKRGGRPKKKAENNKAAVDKDFDFGA